ncbi:T6SS immunity protein Tli4 family protein [Aquabacterium commune]|nr:T6SS immunity protein Tli4 family protein [Aquabacterium commune]
MSRLFAALLLALTCISCQTEARNMTQPRIDKMFEKTKSVCFGRFVMDVPMAAQVVPGPQAFGSRIESLQNDAKGLTRRARAKREEVHSKTQTIDRAEVVSLNEGPTAGSWILRYWDDEISKKVGLQDIVGYFAAQPHGFIYPSATRNHKTPEQVLDSLTYIATHLRARDPAEVPQEPGVCLDVGFIADDTGKFQEIFGIGLRFPELPDASFSISTNKDAQQGDSFEARRSEARRAALMVPELATAFAKIKTLREGKRKVQQGDGSEALFRRPLGDTPGHWHEFQFEYAGKRFDHRNPSWDAALFTGVERDQAGSVASGLSDDEAIALWDRLMASVRLRVVK